MKIETIPRQSLTLDSPPHLANPQAGQQCFHRFSIQVVDIISETALTPDKYPQDKEAQLIERTSDSNTPLPEYLIKTDSEEDPYQLETEYAFIEEFIRTKTPCENAYQPHEK